MIYVTYTLTGNLFLFPLPLDGPPFCTIEWLAGWLIKSQQTGALSQFVSIRMQLLHDRATRHGSTTATSKKVHAARFLGLCNKRAAGKVGSTTEPRGEKKRMNAWNRK
jgi:hypothetical protein